MKPLKITLVFSLSIGLAGLLGTISCSTADRAARTVAAAQGDGDAERWDIGNLNLGQVGVPGGVTHSSVKDQQNAEICWSYTLSALAEAAFRKSAIDRYLEAHPDADKAALKADMAHHTVRISPEYLQFYHIYYTIKTHLDDFSKLAAKYQKEKSHHNNSKRRAQAKAIAAAYGLKNPDHPDTEHFFHPDTGALESLGLREAALFGMVPETIYNVKIGSEKQETVFENALSNFVGEYMIEAPDNIALYQSTDAASGINRKLFHDLSAYLRPILGITPHRPDQQFHYPANSRETYTPGEFMRRYMHFDPNDYVAVRTNAGHQREAMQWVATAMDQDYLVPLGLDLFDSKQDKAQASGVFTERDCDKDENGVPCLVEDGGHEVTGVNYYYRGTGNRKEVTAIVVKNSWGALGSRDANGVRVETPNARGTGYFIVTSGFLAQTTTPRINDPWDIVLPKTILQQVPEGVFDPEEDD